MKTNRLLVELMALISIMPVFRANLHAIVLLIVFILWLINSIQRSSIGFIFNDKWGVAKWWAILITYELALSLIGFSTIAPNTIITRIPVYLVPVIMTFVIRKYSYRDQKRLFIFITGIIVFTIIQNIIIYLQNPSLFSNFRLKEEIYRWTNWGTSGFVATTLFLVPCCFFVLHNKTKGVIHNLAYLGFILPFVYISLINTRATSFVLLLFFIVALLYVKNVRINNKISYTLITIVIAIVGFALVVPLLDWLSSVLRVERLAIRLDSIVTSLQNLEIDEYSEGSLFDRYYLALVSIRTWTSSFGSFFFGIGEDLLGQGSTGTVLELEELGIGQHSQIIDFLAMYGVVGTTMLIKAFHSTFSCIKSVGEETLICKREISVFFIGYILMNLLNNTLYADELFVVFVLFVLSIRIYCQPIATPMKKESL